ncbi:acyl-CoA N-acyltransferase [Aspergillus ambiguus]|uniref:GNAT family N-acetyltransferase n=1 Tax=Aspergillus ambiguus TaxID=176160 RepID=UPI003CCCE3CF
MLQTHILPPTEPSSPRFRDALAVRIAVFVDEQHIPLELEVDAEDSRSWHWVVYEGTSPVATARLVPPPAVEPGGQHEEPRVRIGRVAVVKAYRGRGIASQLVQTIVSWAQMHADRLEAGTGARWKGLVMVHSQVPVQGVYGRVGFVRDEAMGQWEEDGIAHVGMWRRVEVGGTKRGQ